MLFSEPHVGQIHESGILWCRISFWEDFMRTPFGPKRISGPECGPVLPMICGATGHDTGGGTVLVRPPHIASRNEILSVKLLLVGHLQGQKVQKKKRPLPVRAVQRRG